MPGGEGYYLILYKLIYRIARNFRSTLFSEISETSGIFRKFFYEMVLYKFFKPAAKKEKITENFENIFPKYPLKRIFRKFRLTKISGYTVSSLFISNTAQCLMV